MITKNTFFATNGCLKLQITLHKNASFLNHHIADSGILVFKIVHYAILNLIELNMIGIVDIVSRISPEVYFILHITV